MSSTVTLGGNPVQVAGDLPKPGQQARPFTLVGKDLADVTLASFAGKRKILNIFPSVDTPTALSVSMVAHPEVCVRASVATCVRPPTAVHPEV